MTCDTEPVMVCILLSLAIGYLLAELLRDARKR